MLTVRVVTVTFTLLALVAALLSVPNGAVLARDIAVEFVDVTSGYEQACAADTGGAVWCWGTSTEGELGLGVTKTPDVSSPTATLLTDGALQVESLDEVTCALTDDGDVLCWGDNVVGQVGDGSALADEPTPTALPSVAGAVADLSVGEQTACVILAADQSVQCWGRGNHGQLGDGLFVDRATPAEVTGLSGPALQVAVGYDHACALIEGGTVQCWGQNSNGELGDGTGGADAATPVDVVGLAGAAEFIAVGNDVSCAIVVGGGLQCWGDSADGMLGNGTTTPDVLSPGAALGLPAVAHVSLGDDTACAVATNGDGWCWGSNGNGEVGDGTTIDRLTPTAVAGPQGFAKIDVGDGTVCGLTTTGLLRCWGDNGDGQAGDGSVVESATPVPVQGLEGAATELAVGEAHVCAVDGAATVRCWGAGEALGTGLAELNQGTAVAVSGAAGFTDLSAGADHTCALSSGEVRCWGDNGVGQLGDGGVSGDLALAPVTAGTLSSSTLVAAGRRHTCAFDTVAGTVCWGSDFRGQLGHGDSAGSHDTPQVVTGPVTDTLALVAGGDHTCAVRSGDGQTYCWGNNSSWQVNEALGSPVTTPMASAAPVNLTSLSSFDDHTCGLDAGSMVCWGSNGLGQSTSPPSPQVAPTAHPGLPSDIIAAAAGTHHTCAATISQVWCWGNNDDSQLGRDSYEPARETPMPVLGLSGNVLGLASGGNTTCATTTGNGTVCWGDGGSGELGSGATTQHLTPVALEVTVPQAVVPTPPPTADIGGPYEATWFGSVTVDASASTGRAGRTLAFAWDLDGDGAYDDADAAVANLQVETDDVEVAVRVTDVSSGLTDLATATVSVVPPAPWAAEDNVARAIMTTQEAFPAPTATRQDGLAATVLLGTAEVFADSLASGGLQGALDAPLLLTGPDELDDRVAAELDRLGATSVTLLGGPDAVGDAVATALGEAGYAVERLAGATRVETAVAIAAAGLPDATRALLVRAFPSPGSTDGTQAFADSLAAGAAAARIGAPVLLTQPDALSEAVATYLAGSAITEVVVVGGQSAIGQPVIDALEALDMTVTVVAGAERAATAVALAGLTGEESGSVASGAILADAFAEDTWADAFPAAVLAARTDQPLLLTRDGEVPAATATWLDGARLPLTCLSLVTGPACTAAADLVAG